MGCETSMIKYLLFIFNLVFALSGLAILILGVLIENETSDYIKFLDHKFSAPPIVLIVVGLIIFIIAFFGCCGTIREDHCMIVTFAVLLLSVFIIEIVIGGIAFVYSNDAEGVFDYVLDTAMESYKNQSSKATMDSIQKALKCCGSDGPHDYIHYSLEIPASCCKNPEAVCPKYYSADLNYSIGCKEALKEFIRYSTVLLGGVAIGVAFIELVGVIFSLCLANSIKNKSRRRGI